MGVFSSVTGFAVLSGPLLGGAVVQGISWPWIFWLNVPIALLLIVLTRTHLSESHGTNTKLDPQGLVLFTTASLALVWALMRGNAAGWSSLEVTASLISGLAFGAAFAAHELRIDQPMLPLNLFKHRAFSAGNVAVFCWSASVLGTLFFMAQFFQVALAYGPLETGVKLMPWGATTFLVPQLAGRLINKYGERWFAAGGLALEAASMAWLALIASPEVAYGHLVAPLVLSGAGFALAIPAIQSAVISSVEPSNIGRASGTLSTLRQLGSVFGMATVASGLLALLGAGGYAEVRASAAERRDLMRW
jgi:MFS family permease